MRRLAQAATLLLPPLVLARLGWEQRWVAEDAFIDLRVVQHLLAGHGPVFNLGERVEAYSNPLWVVLLALLALPFARPAPPSADLPWGTIVPLEWIAVGAGLAGAIAGLIAAIAGALRLSRLAGTADWGLEPAGLEPAGLEPAGLAAVRAAGQAGGWDTAGLALPLGAIVFAALPAVWDFVTSGLETGLSLGWLGLTFWALSLRVTRRRLAPWCAALAGAGPLIRPDLAIYSAAFLVVLLLGAGPRRGLSRAGAGLLAAGLALPLAYQVFRMGYFAALVPNTGLAKEAGLPYWTQGLRYLRDFVVPYLLWLPLAVLFLWWGCRLPMAYRTGHRLRPAPLALLVAPPIGGLLHALYVVRVGGDFMHARMLIPALFALLLPVMVVVIPTGRWARPAAGMAAVVVSWSLVAALWLRPPYYNAGPEPPQSVGSEGIADERGFYVRLSRQAHPVTLADYELTAWAQDGHALRRQATRQRALILWGPAEPAVPGRATTAVLDPSVPANVVVVRDNIGLTGYAAGVGVHVVDRLGLGDPLAARLHLARRGRPGHEKELPDAWVVARFGPDVAGPLDVAAARIALTCGDLAELLPAVEARLTPSRFWRNLGLATRLTWLRFPADPAAARAQLCSPRPFGQP